MELFAKEGSRGTSLAAIADRLGVTPPAITHHFGTKRALLMEVVEQADRLVQERMQPPTGISGMKRISANRTWAQLLVSDGSLANLFRLVLVMIAEALDDDFPTHQYFVARQREFRELMIDVVVSGQKDGSIVKDRDPKVLATEIMAFMQGAHLQWLLDPEDVPIERLFDDYFNQLQRNLMPPRRKASTRAGQRGRRESG